MTQSTSAVMIKRRPRLWKIVMDTLKPASGCHVNLILTRHFILVTGHLLETMMMSALLWSQPVLWELKRNHQTTVILQPDNVWLVIMWRMKCVISISNIVSMKKMKKMLKIILMMSVLQLFKWYYTLLIDWFSFLIFRNVWQAPPWPQLHVMIIFNIMSMKKYVFKRIIKKVINMKKIISIHTIKTIITSTTMTTGTTSWTTFTMASASLHRN